MNIDKVKDLELCIGESVSENFSETLRAKLISVDAVRGVCLMEVVKSPYTSMKTMGSLNEDKIGKRYEAPIARVWNAYYY